MNITTTTPTCAASRRRSYNPSRHHGADFARQATIDTFGWRHARALDQADFLDRQPGDMPKSSPEARFR